MIWIGLPDDIKNKIQEYIIKQDISKISKTHFLLYYDVHDKRLLRRLLLNVIRKDHAFIFKQLFNKYYTQFKNTKRYRYDGIAYKHFAEFLKFRIIDYQSMKCKIIISEKLTNEYKWM